MSRAGGPEKKASDKQTEKANAAPRKRAFAVDDPARQVLIEAKRRLAMGLGDHGIPDLIRILETGPGDTDEQNKLWQYALTFAADRGGLPRVEAAVIDAAAIPPLEVRLKGFARPSDT
ncbi:MAG: hypothetical protein ABL977_08110 [Candidatus Eisenbacteria bacterium]